MFGGIGAMKGREEGMDTPEHQWLERQCPPGDRLVCFEFGVSPEHGFKGLLSRLKESDSDLRNQNLLTALNPQQSCVKLGPRHSRNRPSHIPSPSQAVQLPVNQLEGPTG